MYHGAPIRFAAGMAGGGNRARTSARHYIGSWPAISIEKFE
jgi:hypothetical protein